MTRRRVGVVIGLAPLGPRAAIRLQCDDELARPDARKMKGAVAAVQVLLGLAPGASHGVREFPRQFFEQAAIIAQRQPRGITTVLERAHQIARRLRFADIVIRHAQRLDNRLDARLRIEPDGVAAASAPRGVVR